MLRVTTTDPTHNDVRYVVEDLATLLGNTEEFLETLQSIEKERRIGNKSQQHNMMNILIVSKV